MLLYEKLINTENINTDSLSRECLLERLTLALNAARMGVFDCDLGGRTMVWDARMHEICRIKPGTFSGKYDDFLGLVHFEDRPRLVREMTSASGERTEPPVKFRVLRPSTCAPVFLETRINVHFRADGSPSSATGICWEASEQRDAEAQLVQERYFLSTMMDNLPDRIYAKDRESRFTLVNHAFLRGAGFKEQSEIIGKTDKDLFTDEHACAALADEQRILATGEPMVGIEEKETWHDGREVWVSTTKVPIRNASGEVIGTFGLSRDMTERRVANEALASYARQQESVSQLGQLGLAGAEIIELCDEAVKLVAQTLEVDLCGIFELQPSGDVLRLSAGVGWNEGCAGGLIIPTGNQSQVRDRYPSARCG